MWDSSEKAWPDDSFVMKSYAGPIDQERSTDMTGAEIRTDASSNGSMTPRRKSRSVQLYFVLIMLYTEPQRRGGCFFQAYSRKNNARS